MNHIKSYDAFHAENAHLYEGNQNTNESSSPTLYESIKGRAFGELVKKEGSLLEHAVDDAFLQDLGDLAQVNESGQVEHLDKTFAELLESFNDYYGLEILAPKNPKAIFESLADWYNENEENITPERFEQKFALAVVVEDFSDGGSNLHDSHLRSDRTSTVKEDEAKVEGIVAKAAGSLAPDEFKILCQSRIRARGQQSTKELYAKLHARWNEEIEAHKSKTQKPVADAHESDPDAMFQNNSQNGIAANATRD